MMDNLQEAYTAYQQALYYLPDPKVCTATLLVYYTLSLIFAGTQVVVWHRYPL